MNHIEIQNLYVSYDNTQVIKNMTIEIPKGEVTMIIGSNGCGKSTLLKTIARVISPKKGIIKINGKNIQAEKSRDIAKYMAVLPQSPISPPGLIVKDLISYGRFPHKKLMGNLNKEDLEIINWAMEVTGVSDFANRRLDSLSGGQRQRAWIAMSLAQQTEIILLDEPTTYLDMSHQLEILLLLQKLAKTENRTIVVVLHELNNATRFADYIIGMKNGDVIFSGKPINVITKENLLKIYGIKANIQINEEKGYPVCVDFDLE